MPINSVFMDWYNHSMSPESVSCKGPRTFIRIDFLKCPSIIAIIINNTFIINIIKNIIITSAILIKLLLLNCNSFKRIHVYSNFTN